LNRFEGDPMVNHVVIYLNGRSPYVGLALTCHHIRGVRVRVRVNP